jgi:ligand-binding sensor domain-containing protein
VKNFTSCLFITLWVAMSFLDAQYTNYQPAGVTRITSSKNYIWCNGAGLTRIDKATGARFTFTTKNSGMPSDSISSLIVDKNDVLWIGTDSGVVSYNGSDWKVFNTGNSLLPSNAIQCFCVDSINTKWIATKTQLVKYDGLSFSHVPIVMDTTRGLYLINCLSIGDSSKLYFAGIDSLLVIDTTYSHGKPVITTVYKREPIVASFGGNIWRVESAPAFSGGYGLPTGLVVENNGAYWLSTSLGLLQHTAAGWKQHLLTNSNMPTNFVFAAGCAKDGTKWFGTQRDNSTSSYVMGARFGGLTKIQDTVFTTYTTKNSTFPFTSVSSLHVDADGIVWAGTALGAIVKFDGTNSVMYSAASGLQGGGSLYTPGIYSVDIDKDGNKFIGSADGLVKFTDNSWRIYFNEIIPNPPSDSSTMSYASLSMGYQFHSTCQDSKGAIWASAKHYLYPNYCWLYKCDNGIWIKYDTTYNGNHFPYYPSTVKADKNDNIWVADSYAGLGKFNGTNWTIFNTSNSGLPSNCIWGVAIDSKGIKWLGTDKGLVKYDDTSWTIYNTTNGKSPIDNITVLYFDKNDNLWFGSGRNQWGAQESDTGAGLIRFTEAGCQIFNSQNSGLPQNSIAAITADSKNALWIGTDTKGLVKFDGSNWTSYSLPGNYTEWRISAIAIDDSNHKWIGSSYNTYPVGTSYDYTSTVLTDFYEGNANGVTGQISSAKKVFELQQNYPNPFNPSTNISYTVADRQFVNLKVVDILGREVATLVNEEKPAGQYSVKFNAANIPSGVYFYKLQAGSNIQTKKMILLK